MLIPIWRQITFVIVVLVIVHLFIYIICRNRPYSFYYNPDTFEIDRLFERSKQEAFQTLADYRAKNFILNKGRLIFDEPDARHLCVGVISDGKNSMRRNLSGTLGALLGSMSNSFKDRVSLAVYNTSQPLHKNWEAESLRQLVRVIGIKYPIGLYNDVVKTKPRRVKKLLDHKRVMRDMYERGCESGLILEDRVLPSKNWLRTILDIISDSDKWKDGMVALRIFSNFDGEGFKYYRVKDILLILSLAAAGVLLTYGICGIILLLSPESPIKRELLSPNVLVILFLFVGMILAVLIIGRQNIVMFRNGIEKGLSNSNSNLATLYPRNQLYDFSMILDKVFTESGHQNSLDKIPSQDKLLRILTKYGNRKRQRKHFIGTLIPSLFQIFDTEDDIKVANEQMKISFDFLNL